MNDQRPYGMLPPGASRLKRKEREPLHPAKRPQPPPPQPRATVTSSTTMKPSTGSKGTEITSSNKLLAGYLAYEFLTKGTLLGQKYDTARAETAVRGKLRAAVEPTTALKGNESYKEISSQLMMKSEGGTHIPGIVNPAQLARWIQM